MTRPPPVRAVGAVVPARNEQGRIGGCLRALRAALEELPLEVSGAICVVLDRCHDATADEVQRALCGRCRVTVDLVSNQAGMEIGEVRDLGVRRLLTRLAGVPQDQIWLLNTDADSAVPAHWASEHVRRADNGADAVAGTVSLDDPSGLDAHVLSRYTEFVAAGVRGNTHDHAYGANLGLRAVAYTAVGGFPSVAAGEDHGLLARLTTHGYRIVRPADLTVCTSARLTGRAPGGLAALLARLGTERPVELRT